MNYIALTVGPIYKTLQNAKNPKALWSGSYLFSYIMKQIISEFKTREFITPYIKAESIFDTNSDLGLFHDRFIFQSKENDIYKLKSVIDDLIQQLSLDMGVEKNIVASYLQINYDEYKLDDDKNPILEISPYLDTQELFFQASNDTKNSFINALKSKENFLLKKKNIVDDIKKLTYKNYYCIVHADGDNMSKAIEKKKNIANVSESLFEYCKASSEMIKAFGGQTIFAGGDDLLFIAPVVNGDETQTIFNLCDTISKDFDNRFNGVASLSFGVGINYVKFPLYEALQNSRNLLFVKAKEKFKKKEEQRKNNIAFGVTKHSGQTFETIIHKGDEAIYNHFLSLSSNIKDSTGVDNFLHSLHHKIDTHKTTLNRIATNKKRLKNFFDNYFNKEEHKQYIVFFEQLIDFIYEVFQNKKIEDKDKLNIIYSTLRFVKFLKGDKQ